MIFKIYEENLHAGEYTYILNIDKIPISHGIPKTSKQYKILLNLALKSKKDMYIPGVHVRKYSTYYLHNKNCVCIELAIPFILFSIRELNEINCLLSMEKKYVKFFFGYEGLYLHTYLLAKKYGYQLYHNTVNNEFYLKMI